jgi:hypothetical protein
MQDESSSNGKSFALRSGNGKFEANNFIYKSISNGDITLVLYIDKKRSLYNATLMVIPL